MTLHITTMQLRTQLRLYIGLQLYLCCLEFGIWPELIAGVCQIPVVKAPRENHCLEMLIHLASKRHYILCSITGLDEADCSEIIAAY